MMKKLLIINIFLICAVFFVSAQCYKDLHSTNAYDGWMSCNPSTNPAIFLTHKYGMSIIQVI